MNMTSIPPCLVPTSSYVCICVCICICPTGIPFIAMIFWFEVGSGLLLLFPALATGCALLTSYGVGSVLFAFGFDCVFVVVVVFVFVVVVVVVVVALLHRSSPFSTFELHLCIYFVHLFQPLFLSFFLSFFLSLW